VDERMLFITTGDNYGKLNRGPSTMIKEKYETVNE